MPGNTDGNRNAPVASLVVDNTPPPALRASTNTPGSTAPVVSFTTPSILPRCSWAAAGHAKSRAHSSAEKIRDRINHPPGESPTMVSVRPRYGAYHFGYAP